MEEAGQSRDASAQTMSVAGAWRPRGSRSPRSQLPTSHPKRTAWEVPSEAPAALTCCGQAPQHIHNPIQSSTSLGQRLRPLECENKFACSADELAGDRAPRRPRRPLPAGAAGSGASRGAAGARQAPVHVESRWKGNAC